MEGKKECSHLFGTELPVIYGLSVQTDEGNSLTAWGFGDLAGLGLYIKGQIPLLDVIVQLEDGIK